MGFLLALLGFLSPITISLPLITFRAYWPLSQSNEFTNSFPRLSWPIYFLFTSYYSHKLTTSFLGLSRPLYSLFTSFDSCELADHQFCHFSLLGCFLILLLFFLSHFSYIVRLLLLLGPLSKVGINWSSFLFYKEVKPTLICHQRQFQWV